MITHNMGEHNYLYYEWVFNDGTIERTKEVYRKID